MAGLSSWMMGTAGLVVVLGLSCHISYARPFPLMPGTEQRSLLFLGLSAWVVQAAHFAEEFLSGFPEAFPVALGLSPWSRSSFVVFNVGWLVTWLVALHQALRGRRVAEWPLWFLALAMVLNGIAHPLLSLREQAYFPGLWTSIPAGLAGVLLFRRLLRMTGRTSRPTA